MAIERRASVLHLLDRFAALAMTRSARAAGKSASASLGQPIEPPGRGLPLDPLVEARRLESLEPRSELRELIGRGFFGVFKGGHSQQLASQGRSVIALAALLDKRSG